MLLPIPIFPYSFEPCANCWKHFCMSYFFSEAVFLQPSYRQNSNTSTQPSQTSKHGSDGLKLVNYCLK